MAKKEKEFKEEDTKIKSVKEIPSNVKVIRELSKNEEGSLEEEVDEQGMQEFTQFLAGISEGDISTTLSGEPVQSLDELQGFKQRASGAAASQPWQVEKPLMPYEVGKSLGFAGEVKKYDPGSGSMATTSLSRGTIERGDFALPVQGAGLAEDSAMSDNLRRSSLRREMDEKPYEARSPESQETKKAKRPWE